VGNDLDKLILAFVIGGLLSGGAFYLMRANPKQKRLFFKRIGKIVNEVGEFLQESDLEEKNAAFEELIKSVPKGQFADLMRVAAMGVTLWNKWR
jgi:hypothetical protein